MDEADDGVTTAASRADEITDELARQVMTDNDDTIDTEGGAIDAIDVDNRNTLRALRGEPKIYDGSVNRRSLRV